MAGAGLQWVEWFRDQEAQARGDPGLVHSYVGAAATALRALGEEVDPVWLMGASSFAFRINVHEALCPSAISVFDWRRVLPLALEQLGHACTHVSRFWHEEELRGERQQEAHAKILTGFERGVPSVVWDVHGAEWGVLTGYGTDEETYQGLASTGERVTLPRALLGDREIKILSVIIPEEQRSRDRGEVIHRSLVAAVAHARQEEWMERPKYQDGLEAFEQWARALHPETGGAELGWIAGYSAAHNLSGRYYAYRYLEAIAGGDESLQEAAQCYRQVAASLRPVWVACSQESPPDDEARRNLAQLVREAGTHEARGVNLLEDHLIHHPDPGTYLE